MKKIAKKLLKGIINSIGFNITRARGNLDVNKFKWLQELNIRTVIDVGGSKGNASLHFHSLFPKAKIYAFEPLRDCFQIMNDKMKHISNFKSFNIALSDTKGQDIIHRSSYSGCSSLRKMEDIHKNAFPITAGERDEVIQTDTMDNALEQYPLEDNILVKIDVQGLEDKVIAGGIKTLQQAKVAIIETSFVELYKGQSLFNEICGLLSNLGFRYSGAWDPDLKNPLDGASLQQDSIFIKL